VHLADSVNFEGVATNKLCNGLTGSGFELPNDIIPPPLAIMVKQHLIKELQNHKQLI
jgi:hypothetical protein